MTITINDACECQSGHKPYVCYRCRWETAENLILMARDLKRVVEAQKHLREEQ